ncbi:MAG: hypothetical protein QOJ85_374 [Solirubrobacteraceae bacterium]|nr:hypothetical protein [Solirubrobacteraceae bacterium]MEA2245094.1 hypothetical protein [Solirubrobacteraceae bacterium]
MSTDDVTALRVQVARQVAHWQAAVVGLGDPESFASATAWRTLERYLDVALRRHLREAADRLVGQADVLAAELRAAATASELEALRVRVIAFRRRYLQVETALDFYGHAINSRTSPRLAGLLSACDRLATMSMQAVLVPLRCDVPPVLTYVNSGMGASVLRAGLRLWDGGSLSPAAAVKITRQNLLTPTALIHETGHQVAHIVGWNEELAELLRRELASASTEVASAWASWASEIAADTHAFVHTGYGSVAALHDVVSGGPTVFRHIPGDPHPIAYLRVLLGTAMCTRFFGAGPWDDLARAWSRSYPIAAAPRATRGLVERSLPLLPRIAELCLLAPLRAFRGRPITSIVDPLRVRPEALARLVSEAGGALTTSSHWLGREGLRLLALSSYRSATEPERAAEIAAEYEDWMLRLGRPLAAAA